MGKKKKEDMKIKNTWTRRSQSERRFEDENLFKPCWKKERPEFLLNYNNTPLSCGYDIAFISNHPAIKKKYRSDLEFLNHHYGVKNTSAAIACRFDNARVMSVSLAPFSSKVSMVRLLELIVHEVSHIVDYLFEQTNIKVIDTKLRAYMNDHICGLIFQRINFSYKSIN